MNKLKTFLTNVPPWLGVFLAALPFRYRLGHAYAVHKVNCTKRADKIKNFEKVKALVEFAEKEIEFYQCFYRQHGFNSAQLRSFDDLTLIPILTKTDLQEFQFEQRVLDANKGIISNTGGTSGQPLKVLLDGDAYAREWAHMHTIWEQLDYKITCLKLTIRGMDLGGKPLKYNFIHNEFQVNAYCEFPLVIEALTRTLTRYKIEYLHGYPSGIYEFIKQLEQRAPDLLAQLSAGLKGVFFGSEYPAPVYREYIEETLKVATISWYGHTEMTVLAREMSTPYVYFPFQSYGYTEAVEIDGKHHLIGTSIHNKLGPLIRYDTGDLIEPLTYQDELLESFKIAQGRIGEFVTDKNGRNISLTALIFGRHHELFGYADFIQVQQLTSGQLTIFVTSSNPHLQCADYFNNVGIDMDIIFKIVTQPFKTPAGKVPLIVKG